MQFVDSLLVGLEDVPWQIAAPVGGIEARLDAIIENRELYLDLSIVRDNKYMALIRILPDTILGMNRDGSRHGVFHIERATAFFLDLDREMTEHLVELRVVIHTGETPPDLSVGYVVMWPGDTDFIATAS
jgi:hypothetical protein